MYYVYLIRLDEPLGSTKHQARFYVGIARNLRQRLKEHRSGQGSRMLASAVQRGIAFRVVKYVKVCTFQIARSLERKLKARKNHKQLLKIDWCQVYDLNSPLQWTEPKPKSSLLRAQANYRFWKQQEIRFGLSNQVFLTYKNGCFSVEVTALLSETVESAIPF